MLGSLLVDVGVDGVSLLVDLVTESILGGGSAVCLLLAGELMLCLTVSKVQDIPGGEGSVGVLGDLLVGLLGGGGDALLDSLADVVGGVLDGLHCEGRVVVCEVES